MSGAFGPAAPALTGAGALTVRSPTSSTVSASLVSSALAPGEGPAGPLVPKSKAPMSCFGMGAALKTIRGTVSKKKIRFQTEDFDLDLTYITSRIIAMGFPSQGAEGMYRNPLPEVQRFFETRHAGHYRIYNLCSERAYDRALFCDRVARYPFDDHNPCSLSMIADFCADMDAWLGAHPDNVIAIHCKAGKGRTGLAIAAYLFHSGLVPDPEAALLFFGARRTRNGKGVTIPSQMRYVHYYAHQLRFGPSPVYTYRITHVRLITVPNAEAGGVCAPSVSFSLRSTPVFDLRRRVKRPKRFRRPTPWMDLDLSRYDVRVRGDVMVQFYHESRKLCHLWFHTAFVQDDFLRFERPNIDKANKDKKGVFAPSFAIEFYLHRVPGGPSPPLDGKELDESAVDSFVPDDEGVVDGRARTGSASGRGSSALPGGSDLDDELDGEEEGDGGRRLIGSGGGGGGGGGGDGLYLGALGGRGGTTPAGTGAAAGRGGGARAGEAAGGLARSNSTRRTSMASTPRGANDTGGSPRARRASAAASRRTSSGSTGLRGLRGLVSPRYGRRHDEDDDDLDLSFADTGVRSLRSRGPSAGNEEDDRASGDGRSSASSRGPRGGGSAAEADGRRAGDRFGSTDDEKGGGRASASSGDSAGSGGGSGELGVDPYADPAPFRARLRAALESDELAGFRGRSPLEDERLLFDEEYDRELDEDEDEDEDEDDGGDRNEEGEGEGEGDGDDEDGEDEDGDDDDVGRRGAGDEDEDEDEEGEEYVKGRKGDEGEESDDGVGDADGWRAGGGVGAAAETDAMKGSKASPPLGAGALLPVAAVAQAGPAAKVSPSSKQGPVQSQSVDGFSDDEEDGEAGTPRGHDAGHDGAGHDGGDAGNDDEDDSDGGGAAGSNAAAQQRTGPLRGGGAARAFAGRGRGRGGVAALGGFGASPRLSVFGARGGKARGGAVARVSKGTSTASPASIEDEASDASRAAGKP